MDDLELLKKDWQQEKANEFHQYTENELFAMTKQKSVSVAKWIFIIGLLEICFWFGLDFALYSLDDEPQIYDTLGETFIKISNIISKMISLGFLGYIFYLNHKIKNVECSQKLMKKILLIKNTVRLYIKIVIFQFAFFMFVGLIIGVTESMQENNIQINSQGSAFIAGAIIIMLIISLIFIFLLSLFYRLIYGRFIKQLEENYKELSKIEE